MGIHHDIKYLRRNWAPLRYSPVCSKRLPKSPVGPTQQFSILPEKLYKTYHLRADSVGFHNENTTPPVHGIIRLLEINIDPVKWLLLDV